MSGKLDQSLDDILKTSRRSATKGGRGRGGRRVSRPGKPTAAAAPVGGIKKTTKQAKAVPTGPSGRSESKIQLSNLPTDAAVNEGTLKEYFSSPNLGLGPVKRVEMSYGPGGNPRGIATIIFVRPDSAQKAAQACKDVKIDGRPMKIEVILDARQVAAIPPPKGLSERITAPKAQPKSAVPTKNSTASTRGKTRGAKKARNPRPAKKTAEELDSEMADYWESGVNGGEAAATSGAAPNGDANMDGGIL